MLINDDEILVLDTLEDCMNHVNRILNKDDSIGFVLSYDSGYWLAYFTCDHPWGAIQDNTQRKAVYNAIKRYYGH